MGNMTCSLQEDNKQEGGYVYGKKLKKLKTIRSLSSPFAELNKKQKSKKNRKSKRKPKTKRKIKTKRHKRKHTNKKKNKN